MYEFNKLKSILDCFYESINDMIHMGSFTPVFFYDISINDNEVMFVCGFNYVYRGREIIARKVMVNMIHTASRHSMEVLEGSMIRSFLRTISFGDSDGGTVEDMINGSVIISRVKSHNHYNMTVNDVVSDIIKISTS